MGRAIFLAAADHGFPEAAFRLDATGASGVLRVCPRPGGISGMPHIVTSLFSTGQSYLPSVRPVRSAVWVGQGHPRQKCSLSFRMGVWSREQTGSSDLSPRLLQRH